jgi:hypothetical protein
MGAETEHAQAFSRELAALKRRGTNLLVVNDPGGSHAACSRLLGGSDLDRRHVFVPTTTSLEHVLDRHGPRRTDPPYFGVVDASTATRRGATAVAPGGNTTQPVPDRAWYSTVDDLGDADELFRQIDQHLTRIAEDADSPGEVRLCIDSLDPLFEAMQPETLFQFLHAVTSRVREERGMGHCHIAAGVDEEAIATVEPLFDATIFVEHTDDTIRQRWRLHEADQETDWFALE